MVILIPKKKFTFYYRIFCILPITFAQHCTYSGAPTSVVIQCLKMLLKVHWSSTVEELTALKCEEQHNPVTLTVPLVVSGTEPWWQWDENGSRSKCVAAAVSLAEDHQLLKVLSYWDVCQSHFYAPLDQFQ